MVQPPLDKKGAPRYAKRLDGKFGYLAIQRNPVSLEPVANVAALAPEFRGATVRLTGIQYDLLIAALAVEGGPCGWLKDQIVAATEHHTAPTLKAALVAGTEVEGASLRQGEMRLALPPKPRGSKVEEE